MREVERFEVMALDGRTWRFALMQRETLVRDLGGKTEWLPTLQEFRSLDDPERFCINEIGRGRFKLVDFHSDGPDFEVIRI